MPHAKLDRGDHPDVAGPAQRPPGGRERVELVERKDRDQAGDGREHTAADNHHRDRHDDAGYRDRQPGTQTAAAPQAISDRRAPRHGLGRQLVVVEPVRIVALRDRPVARRWTHLVSPQGHEIDAVVPGRSVVVPPPAAESVETRAHRPPNLRSRDA